MDKLLPCPFCGGEARAMQYGEQEYLPTCKECDCILDYCFHSNEDAIAAWNRRAQQENKPLTLDELREMDGEPVYIVYPDKPENNRWVILVGIGDEDVYWAGDNYDCIEYIGEDWIPYRSEPKEEV